jgi:predicted transport protein
MSDLKLYRLVDGAVTELSGGAVALEKSLQFLFEKNLEALLGVRFLASEFVTTEGGRMDTLGIDENNCPVVIEYKRSSNENVINQGLFYLEWLVGHRKDFEWLVLEKLGAEAAKSVDWSGPRLICIAGDFSKYDDKAVKIMNRNIALIRYRKFDGEMLLLEQLTATSAKPIIQQSAPNQTPAGPAKLRYKYKTVTDQIAESSKEMGDLYHSVTDYLTALGDDVQVKTTEYYIAFRRLKNFASLELRNQSKKLLVYVKVDPDTVSLEAGFTRDVRGIGHFGTGDLEITIQGVADLEKAKPLFDRAYDGS